MLSFFTINIITIEFNNAKYYQGKEENMSKAILSFDVKTSDFCLIIVSTEESHGFCIIKLTVSTNVTAKLKI